MKQRALVALLVLMLSSSVAVAADLKAKPRPQAASTLMPPWGPGWGEKLTPEQARAEKARVAAPKPKRVVPERSWWKF